MVKSKDIPVQLNASDMMDKFIATVLSITEKNEQGTQLLNKSNRPIIKVVVEIVQGSAHRDGKEVNVNGETFIISYTKPKALTGNSQLDVLFYKMDKLGLSKDTDALVNKTFLWERADLPGSMKGNARFYPTEIIEGTKAVGDNP